MLYEFAVMYGAEIRLGAQVSSIDPQTCSITLHSGEVVKGDVIVGADGVDGLARGYLQKAAEENDGNQFCMHRFVKRFICIFFLIRGGFL